jgi:Rrf2 family transcriptional regulator, cysteine metabolism repressor
MFALSTKGRYAARAMVDLALRNTGTPVRLKDIAKGQGISEKYLSRLMASLVQAGFVRSRRGKNGGFALARPPADISILGLLETVEGPVAPAPCLEGARSCRKSRDCAARDLWAEIRDALTSALGGLTLEDAVRRHRENPEPATEPNPSVQSGRFTLSPGGRRYRDAG